MPDMKENKIDNIQIEFNETEKENEMPDMKENKIDNIQIKFNETEKEN